MSQKFILVLTFLLGTHAFGDDLKAPYIVRLKKDIVVRHCKSKLKKRVLCAGSSDFKAFSLRQGRTFKVIELGDEGECKIAINKKKYYLSSCPWMDGFADHERDVYKILPIPKR